jgi:hypothetical protein
LGSDHGIFWKNQLPGLEFMAMMVWFSGILRNLFLKGGSTNSVEDRGQIEWGSGGSSSLVRGSTQFANG